jgi:hypothetical protein
MSTINLTLSQASPTGSLVFTLGTPGPRGLPGAAATVDAGTTTTGSAGSSATVVNVGTTSAAIFNFTIPRGDQGEPGEGVPVGGAAGMVLTKIDTSDYNTQWADPLVFTGGPITSAITLTLGGGNFFTGLFDREVYGVDYTDGSFFDCFNNGIYTGNDALGYMGMSTDGLRFTDGSVQTTAASLFTGGEVANPITMHDGSYDSEMSASVFGVELTSDNAQNASLSYGGLNVQISGSAMNVTATGITFPDATIQTTSATNLGYIGDAPSDGSQYARQDGAWAVVTGGGGGPFLPLAGGTMTGAIVFDGTSGQYISKGNFDTSRGGNYGISLVCSIGYEFNWQAGWLTTTEQGSTTPRPLYLDSGAGTTLRSWNSGDNTGIEVSHTAITFPDSTTQTTSATNLGFIGDAPNDGQIYGRLSAGWSTLTSQGFITQTTADGLYYSISNPSGFVDGAYVSSALTGYATESFVTGQGYINQTTADGLYYSITNPAPFITQGTADTLYYSITNPAGFVDSAYVSGLGYINQTTADSLYYSISNPSSFITQGTADGLYYPLSTNPSGFVDGAYVTTALTGYATESYVTSQGYVDGSYVSNALIGYATESYVISQGYVDASYVSTALYGYATESFVTSQGFITQTTADGLYYPQTNPNNFITPPYNDGSQYVWQFYGWTALDLSGFVGPAPVDGTSYNRTDNAWTQNITFADSTVQTTAAVSGIPEAPVDGNYYVRKDGAWVQAVVVTLNHSGTDYNFLTIP